MAGNQTAEPAFSPGGGTYTSPQTVKISDSTAGAVLYCTTDGTTPTTSSPQCAQPTTVSNTEFLQAIAVAPGMKSSAVMSAGYTINLNAVAAPVFYPAGGNYSSAQSVTISGSSGSLNGVNIYYTIDGTIPTTASTAYTGPITISQSKTLNAIAAASGYGNSPVATATYTIALPLAPPTFDPGSETLLNPTAVTINAASGATIYYTTDGSIPPSSPTTSVYSGPVTVSQVTTINAVAVLGTQTSAMASAAYTLLSASSVPAPTFLTSGGTVRGSGSTVKAEQDQIVLADTDQKATIYYTYDGVTSPSNPQGTAKSAGAIQYTGPFYLPLSYAETGHALIQAFSLDTSYGVAIGSQVSNVYYYVDPPDFSPPSFTPVSGSAVLTGQTIALQDTDSHVTGIYYNIDSASDPTTSSSLYTPGSPIPLPTAGIHTVKAIAVDPLNPNPSPIVSSATYYVGTAGTSLSGHVYTGSGNSPIVGAQVQLFAAGPEGYGTGAVALGSAVTTNSSGAFTMANYVCPLAPVDQIYAVATGGSYAGGTANSKIALMTALGSCGSPDLPTTVTINEVTTIASAYALAAFAQPNSSGGGIDIGAPGVGPQCTAANTPPWHSTGPDTCNYKGLVNAFKAVNNLVNVTGAAQSYIYNNVASPLGAYASVSGTYSDAPGAARSITPGYSNGVTPLFDPQASYEDLTSFSPYTGTYEHDEDYDWVSYLPLASNRPGTADPLPVIPYLNASTVPQARINSLANVLASCVEGDASGCGSGLFAGATPTGGTAPSDTLQAALSIAQNPGSNGVSPSTLLALQPATPPYSPALSSGSAPHDLTLALSFTGAGLGVPYQDANGAVSHYPVIGPGNPDHQVINSALAVDAAGHIWIAGYVTQSATGDVQVLAEFDNFGVGLTAPTVIIDSGYDSVPGGFIPEFISQHTAIGLAIDQSGIPWTTDSTSHEIFPVDPTDGAVPSAFAGVYPASAAAAGIFSIPQGASIAIDGSENIWVQAAQAFSNSGPGVSGIGAAHRYGNANSAVFDSNGNLWGAGADDYSTAYTFSGMTANFDVFQVDQATGNVIYDAFAPTSAIPSTGPASGARTTLVADGNGNVYGCGENGGDQLDIFTPGHYTRVQTLTGGRGCGNLMVLDGQGHIFALSRALKLIDEFDTNGTMISPASGYSGMGGTVNPGSAQEPSTLNYDTTSSTRLGSDGYDQRFGITAAVDGSGNLWVVNPDTGGSGSTGNVLVEYVGLAAPVVTPASTALTNSQLGVRP